MFLDQMSGKSFSERKYFLQTFRIFLGAQTHFVTLESARNLLRDNFYSSGRSILTESRSIFSFGTSSGLVLSTQSLNLNTIQMIFGMKMKILQRKRVDSAGI